MLVFFVTINIVIYNPMNLHPIFVHFPIALLSLYALCEFLRFEKIKQQPAWFYIKAVLVICGTVGALVAISAGDTAKEAVMKNIIVPQVDNPRLIINLHETWAQATAIIFILLAAAYIVAWLNKFNIIDSLPGTMLKKIWLFGTQIQKLLIGTKFVILLALAGLIAITVTGALGGSIIYGPNADPIVKFIYKFIVQ